MKKIKILLAGYVNGANAQNINCDNIAKHLDKSKFEVHALYASSEPIDKKKYKKMGIHLHYVNLHRIAYQLTAWKALSLSRYDLMYLPKLDRVFMNYASCHQGKKLMVGSIENVIEERTFNSESHRAFWLQSLYDVFSISHCIAKSVKKYFSKNTSVLPLGVPPLPQRLSPKKQIKSVVWVGGLIKRKRPFYLLECAKAFPELQFTMIGNGEMDAVVANKIKEDGIQNVTLTGRIPNERVYEYLQKADLLLMTSENEGLPKVIQEAAQCGIPSIYMANNYNVDFIENGVNGFEVYSLEEMIEKIKYLQEHPDEYAEAARKAQESIADYTWDKLIPLYEQWFTDVYHRYQAEKNKK